MADQSDDDLQSTAANFRGPQRRAGKRAAPIRTVELTSKKWKLWQLGGAALFVLGAAMGTISFPCGVPLLRYAGIGTAVCGIVPLLIGSAGAWWNNG